jgi:hypothetical protein
MAKLPLAVLRGCRQNGTFDAAGRNDLSPKGDFFCKECVGWVPEIQGTFPFMAPLDLVLY